MIFLRTSLLLFGFLGIQAATGAVEDLKLKTIQTKNRTSLLIYDLKIESGKVTYILVPGGEGGIGEIVEGQPSNQNFLVRSRGHFFKTPANVLIPFRTAESQSWSSSYRVSKEHQSEIETLVDLAEKNNRPIVLVGMSRGTLSALSYLQRSKDPRIQALVLLSAVTGQKGENVFSLEIEKIKIPVFLVHHLKDECPSSRPGDVNKVLARFFQSNSKALKWIEGGRGASGEVCGSNHWHSFINKEAETVEEVHRWVKGELKF